MTRKLYNIGMVAKKLDVSIETLRRWDKKGVLRSIRFTKTGNRYYEKRKIDLFLKDVEAIGIEWVTKYNPIEVDKSLHCITRDQFQTRLERFQNELFTLIQKDFASLIVAITGEIGNNSFDHNIGMWHDVSGVFFGYSIEKRKIIIADRGQGLFQTLKRVKPDMQSEMEAIHIAFTEIITGRAPEKRGNGLKFVKNIVETQPIELFFQSKNAYTILKQDMKNFSIKKNEEAIQGCLSIITF